MLQTNTGFDTADPLGSVTTRDIAAALWRRWWLLPVLVVSFLGLALTTLFGSRPVYIVEMAITPVTENEESLSGAIGGLSGLASLVGVSLPNGSMGTPFDELLDLLTSQRLADLVAEDHDLMVRLFRRRWNPETESWRPPAGPIASFSRSLREALELPQIGDPGSDDVRRFLQSNLDVTQSDNGAVRYVELRGEDPVMARELLLMLYNAADQAIRQATLQRTSQQIAFLDSRLRTLAVAEHRAALTQLLSDQEKRLMLLQIDQPYAARIIDPPALPRLPIWPRPLLTLGVAGLSAVLLWFVIGVVVAMFGRRRVPAAS
jgi:uncharacterized protein involved in exopolysaccharide biosynthesis